MMNFVQEEKGFCNNEEEDEEEVIGERESTAASDFPFSNFSSSSSSPSPSYHHHHQIQQHQNLWLLGSIDNNSHQEAENQNQDMNFDKKLELMELSLGSNEESNTSGGGGGGGGEGGSGSGGVAVEKEHMFDKVVTPSDVGKLNRLVIPKQHAEKYFPLDSSSNEKGLLLNFEDRNGKSWRFRYSYWNSSQSYVMTKGWSRFVKEKKLDAGDIVSFQRGIGEIGRDRLYIDWRRRPDAPDPAALAHIQFQNQLNFSQSVRWGRLYQIPQSVPLPQRIYEPLQRLNYSIYPYNHPHPHPQPNHHYSHHQAPTFPYPNVPQHNFRSSGSSYSHQFQTGSVSEPVSGVPMVIDSIPVVPGQTAAKRLRLFGVNMDCSVQDDQSPHGKAASSSQLQQSCSRKGKSSLSFDLDQ